MERFGLLAALLLALPAAAVQAQTVKENDLMGVWDQEIDSMGRVIRHDSIPWLAAPPSDSTWRLRGDTLLFFEKSNLKGAPPQATGWFQVAKQDDQHLVLTMLDPKTKTPLIDSIRTTDGRTVARGVKMPIRLRSSPSHSWP